jgi:hypothetical protein
MATSIPSEARMIREILTPEGFERELRTEPKDQWHPAYKVLTFSNETITIEIHFYGGTAAQRRESYMLASGHVSFKTPDGGTRTFDRYGVEDSFYIDNPNKFGAEDRLWENDRVYHNGGLGTVLSAAGYKGWGDDRKFVDETVIQWDDSRSGTVKYTKRKMKSLGIVRADEIAQVNARIKRFIEVKIPESLERIARSESVPSIPFSVTPEQKAHVVKTLLGHKPYRFTPSGFGIGYQLMWKKNPYGGHRADQELEKFLKLSPIYVSQFDAD